MDKTEYGKQHESPETLTPDDKIPVVIKQGQGKYQQGGHPYPGMLAADLLKNPHKNHADKHQEKDIQKTGIICPADYRTTDTVIWGVHK